MLRAACRFKSPPAHTIGYAALFQRRSNQTKAEQAAGSEITRKFSEEEDERKKYELRPISRPLGVSEKPSEFVKSWKEKRDDLLDYDKHIQRRKHLVKEASKAYYHDFHALKYHEGKTWIAPEVLIREDKALYFPDVSGVSLLPQETVHTTSLFSKHTSIVAMITSARSEEHVESFTKSALEAHISNTRFRYIQINLQENVLKGFLVSLFLSSIRARVPTHLQSTYLVSRQNMEYVREPMGMVNKHIGYVYLVDENCKIRWAGGGFAREEEKESLKNCTRVLLQRMSEREGGNNTPIKTSDSSTTTTAVKAP